MHEPKRNFASNNKMIACRAVRRVFCLGGQTPHTPHRGLPYTARVSSWTFLFSPLLRKLPLRPLREQNTLTPFVLNCHDLLLHKHLF